MSLLAHSVCAAWGMQKERRELDAQRLHEVNEAKRIQRETGCTWAQAVRIAAGKTLPDLSTRGILPHLLESNMSNTFTAFAASEDEVRDKFANGDSDLVPMPQKQFVVLVGTVVSGISTYGPFDSRGEASAWGESCGAHWCVAEMFTPTEGE